uniref:Retrovirus-related Pol polyprotein from transposon TNT 1-94 n=1 Tax=Cajanus cajan TaxID=3821 RepID=A0A151SM44_CAJCA|nr:Retrovirus-related Pol polyprotein from transposon TNT 1-94 [Cajanus cajan]
MENSKPISMAVEEKLKLTKESEGIKMDATQYKSLIGSLRYMTTTRPIIVFGVELFSRFMDEPHACHLQEAKRILRYIKGKQIVIGQEMWKQKKHIRICISFRYWCSIKVFKEITDCCTFYH